MDEDLRNEADAILEELGLNMSSAVNIFIRQLVRQGELPFLPTMNTEKKIRTTQRENLDDLLRFASSSKKIDESYRFVRNECYEE